MPVWVQGGGCNCYLGNAQKEVASFKKGLPLPPILKKSSNWNRDTPVPQKNSLLSPFSPIYLGTKWLKGSRAMLSWVSDRNLLSYRELSNNFGFSQNGFHSFCNRKSQHLTFSNQYFIILAASIHNSNSMTELRATFCKYFFEHKKATDAVATKWQLCTGARLRRCNSFSVMHQKQKPDEEKIWKKRL